MIEDFYMNTDRKQQEGRMKDGEAPMNGSDNNDFYHELAAFKGSMPEGGLFFSEGLIETLFRNLYEAVRRRDSYIDTNALVDEIIQSLKNKKLTVPERYRGQLRYIINLMMTHLAAIYHYRKNGLEDLKDEIARVIWPYVAKHNESDMMIELLRDAITDYYNNHDVMESSEVVDFVFERCPGILGISELEALIDDVFSFFSENGFLEPD